MPVHPADLGRRARIGLAGLLALLVAPSAVLLGTAPLRAEDPPAAPAWEDPERLARLFDGALSAVEEECGATFQARPTLRVSTPEEIRSVMEADWQPLSKALGLDAEGIALLSEAMSTTVMALYEDDGHVIHLVPRNLESGARLVGADPPLGEAELRVLLVHEGTHALDWTRFDMEARLHAAADVDQLRALGAVAEGHAQLVAQRVADRWGQRPAFERLTQAITSPPKDVPPEAREKVAAATAFAAFAYVQGLAFMSAVHDARGRKGVEATLATPPRDVSVIEDPRRWLEGETAPRPDLAAVLETLRAVVAEAGWKVQVLGVPRAVLEAFRPRVPESHRDGFLEGLLEARTLHADQEGEPGGGIFMALSFRTPREAQHHLEVERLAVRRALRASEDEPEAASGGMQNGAGPEGSLPGFFLERRVRRASEELLQTNHLARIDDVVVQLVFVQAPWLDRRTQDLALERVALRLRDPDAAAAAPPYPVPPIVLTGRRLRLRVTDPDGAPVPRALVRIHGEQPYERQAAEVRDGACDVRLRHLFDTLRVSVHAARDADGHPLPLAPLLAVPVPAAADEARSFALEVRLVAGVEIRGRVLDADGSPGGDLEVVATPLGHPQQRLVDDLEVATARSAADGSFTLVGLGDAEYELKARRSDEERSIEAGRARGGQTRVEVPLRIPPAIALLVVDPDGQPVADAEVEATQHEGAGPPVSAGARSGPDGVARLRGVVAGRLARLDVTPPEERSDLAAHRVPRWTPADGTVGLARGWTLAGIVRDEQGKPSEAMVHWEVDEHYTRGMSTDDDGTFALRHLPAGPVKVRVGPLRDEPHAWGPAEDEDWTEFAEGATAELVLRARSPGVTLRVLDPDGRPVPRAQVVVASLGASSERELRDGLYTFVPPRTQYHVHVHGARDADGAPLPWGPATLVNRSERSGTLELRLSHGLPLSGRVLDESGAAVAGAEVSVQVPVSGSTPYLGPELEHGRTTTGEDGAFELAGLGAGEYEVHVEAGPGLVQAQPQRVRAGARGVAVRVSQEMRVEVLVVDPEGRPVQGARVRVQRVGRAVSGFTPPAHREDDLLTWSDGTVTLAGLTSEMTIRLEVDPPADADALCRVVTEQRVAGRMEVALERGFAVSGRVVDVEGSPMPEAHVQLVSDGGWNHELVATAARDGTFRTRLLPGSQATLVASTFDALTRELRQSPQVLATRQRPEVTLVLPAPGAPLRLEVAEVRAVRPVLLRGPLGADHERRSTHEIGPDGRLRVADTSPGTYRVWIPPTDDDERCAYRQLTLPTPEPVRLRLAAALAVRVRIVAPAEARITSVAARGPLGDPVPGREVTPGLYEVRGLPAGRWTIEVEAQGAQGALRASDWADVGDEEEIGIEIPPG